MAPCEAGSGPVRGTPGNVLRGPVWRSGERMGQEERAEETLGNGLGAGSVGARQKVWEGLASAVQGPTSVVAAQ